MRGEYLTPTREQIESMLHGERRYLSAAQIFDRLRPLRPGVSLSTVYRTLDRLHAKGALAVRTDAGGEATYLACEPSTHHHHAICRVCGSVEDVPCETMDRFATSLREARGFELDGHSMEFFGRCKSCH